MTTASIPWCRTGAFPPDWIAFATGTLAARLAEACGHPKDHPALAGTTERIARAELRQRIARVAAHVRAAVPPGGVLAVHVPQTPSGVAGLLGAAAAGRICVVLNANDPPERIRLILEDARPAAVLADEAFPLPAGLAHGARRIALGACLAQAPAPAATPATDPDAPCMVHYTSGSSGRPKGIVLSAYSVLMRAIMRCHSLGLRPDDRVLIPTSIADASCLSGMMGALHAGGTALVAGIAHEGAGAFARLARDEGATVLAGSAAVLRSLRTLAAFPQAVARLRLLRFGGAGISAADVADWRAAIPPGCAIGHSYGSTEALLIAEWIVPPGLPPSASPVAMGRPHPGVDHMLADPDGIPVAPGATGEIVLRGRHLALGEWRGGPAGEGQVVAGRLLPDPGRPGERIFRTGDLARMDGDGLLHFMGRADRQVKVNGVRIDLPEVEATLRAVPGVADAAVVQARDGTLHAYLAGPGGDPAALRDAAAAQARTALPAAMRPRRITVLAHLPLLPSGKPNLPLLRRLADGEEAEPPGGEDARGA